MKIITRDERLHKLSAIWTKKKPLVFASFYFWLAGSELQRSLVGIYRTLLYQMLTADERMCRAAFPKWQPKFGNAELTLDMLTIAMTKLLESTLLSKNFFFAIDGLDEYNRDSVFHTEREAIDDIAAFIVANSQGVFLWVVLVLNIAMDGINNHEDLLSVRDRVLL